MSEVVLATIEADVNDGGWRVGGQVFNDADLIDFYQEIEAWFSLYTQSGWEEIRPAFRGHILPEAWTRSLQSSNAPFSGFTAQEFMKRGEIQGIFFSKAAVPANEHQITNMTFSDVIEHILGKTGEYGHCNLVEGIWPEGIITLDLDDTNSTAIDELEVKQGNFWQRINEIAKIDFYYIWIDKANVLHFQPHPMFGGSLPTPVFELDNSLLTEPLQITTRNTEAVGKVKLSGTTPAGLQIFGEYPTEPTAGPIVQRGGYVATADTNMDSVAEWMYKFDNRDYSIVAQIGSGVGLLVDLMDRLSVTYTSADDGISWSEKKFWIHRIVVEILGNFTARTTLTLEAENA